MAVWKWFKGKQVESTDPLEAAGFSYLAEPNGSIGLTLRLRVGQYVNYVETAETTEVCKCEYRVHPDDVEKPKGKRRVARMSVNFMCPAHSREGFLFGFFTWLRENHTGPFHE